MPALADTAGLDPWFLALLDYVQPAAAEDAHLRLGNGDVFWIRVDGIRYKTHVIAVRFDEAAAECTLAF